MLAPVEIGGKQLDEIIRQMRAYQERKLELEVAKERGRLYVEQVRHDVGKEITALEEQLDSARASIEAYIRQENGGEKFRVPGLGTAYLSSRRKTKVVDPDVFLPAYSDRFGDTYSLYDHKLNLSRAAKAAETAILDYGEVLPGIESEEVETVNIRLASA